MILSAEWIFPVTSRPVFRHAIEVKDGRIQRIRPLIDGEPFLRNTCILPGLVNVHTHLAYTALRNLFDHLRFFPWIRKLTEIKYGLLTEKDIESSTQLGIRECLLGGVTTVGDLCDFPVALKSLAISPLRAVFYLEIFGIEKQQADESWRHLQQEYPRLIGEYGRAGFRLGISPHSCYTVRPELFRRVSRWAIEQNIPVSFHLSESKAEEEFVKSRSGPIHDFLQSRQFDWEIEVDSSVKHIEKLEILKTKPLLAHLVQVSKDDIDILAEHQATVAHCPKSNAKFSHGIAPVIDMQNKGLVVGLGTDSAASNNRLDLFEEARFALLMQRARYGEMVLSEEKILQMLTIDGAKALKMEEEIGSIEEGKFADLIAVSVPGIYAGADQVLNHLIHNATPGDVQKVLIGGEEVRVPEIPEGLNDLYLRVTGAMERLL